MYVFYVRYQQEKSKTQLENSLWQTLGEFTVTVLCKHDIKIQFSIQLTHKHVHKKTTSYLHTSHIYFRNVLNSKEEVH